MKHQINASLQVIPIGHPADKTAYGLIDDAIGVIKKSGLRFRVTPMETVIEGPYDEVMNVIRAAQEILLDNGAQELVAHIKVHIHASRDISFEEKTANWES
ncbi:thiamine-binding protein [Fulvivirga sedimenti]|uniref:Thiamine-binding protein n=1 Tax=Fulvivirga sedimenti TaxID=2879465 RepID=A0A9X1HSJ9_9BACT|nr:thiamine-binding protein [Fulvivirga sedimenti]MCA6075427.1 thiamine-binding protein [Fulvivirga sedimenti]MCA6076604.1 thiamine-binding protein [Fulvivirga sedimenti]MCA6077732.1 thiamine-binding protein [Fulvivirga sedimenti]